MITQGCINWRLEVHAELPSTSDTVITRAEAAEPAGLAVLAHVQTKGRGSRGRNWNSPSGNLFLSALLRPGGKIAQAGIWPLIASLAVADALDPLLPNPSRLTLKWPNDVLLAGAKLAGILLDLAADPDGTLRWVVIGTGINLAVAPVLPDRQAACLRDEGIDPPPPENFAQSLLAALGHWHDQPPAQIHTAWLARAHPIGTQLNVRYAGNDLHGTFAGLSLDGYLLLRTESGIRTISSGEVLLSPS